MALTLTQIADDLGGSVSGDWAYGTEGTTHGTYGDLKWYAFVLNGGANFKVQIVPTTPAGRIQDTKFPATTAGTTACATLLADGRDAFDDWP